MIPPMYELERLKVILQYGQVPLANTDERTKLYLKYQFAVCITFWCCRKCPNFRHTSTLLCVQIG